MQHDAKTHGQWAANAIRPQQSSLMRDRATAMNNIIASPATSMMGWNELPGNPMTQQSPTPSRQYFHQLGVICTQDPENARVFSSPSRVAVIKLMDGLS